MATANESQTAPHVTPERLMKMAWGYAAPLSIEAGVRLGFFDALAGQTRTAEEIAAETHCSLRGASMLLNCLVGLEFLEKSPEGAYRLTPESDKFLVSTKPTFMGGIFRHTSQHLLPNWLHLTEVVQTGKPAESVNAHTDGAAFFETFVEDLYPMNYAPARALADHLRLADSTQPVSVLDLAAGSGVWGIALAQASTEVTVRAVDWPSVLKVTERVATRRGVGDRFTYAPGDLLEADFGSGHRVAVLGHILHSEGEERAIALLRKTFQALAPGGTVAIAEFLVNKERTGPLNGLIFAMNMLVQTTNGGTYSFEEIRGWLEKAGFENARTLDAPGPSPLILANRP